MSWGEILRDIIIALIAGAPGLIKAWQAENGLKKKIASLKDEIAELKRENEKQKQRNLDLDLENKNLHGEIETLTQVIVGREEEVSKLRDSFDFLLKQYQEQIHKNETTQAQLNEVKANYNEVKATNDLLKRQYEELCGENQKLKSQLAEVKAKTGSLDPKDLSK